MVVRCPSSVTMYEFLNTNAMVNIQQCYWFCLTNTYNWLLVKSLTRDRDAIFNVKALMTTSGFAVIYKNTDYRNIYSDSNNVPGIAKYFRAKLERSFFWSLLTLFKKEIYWFSVCMCVSISLKNKWFIFFPQSKEENTDVTK